MTEGAHLVELTKLSEVLGNFGEFFGAIAVVITLGYLAIQIRQNTRSNYVNSQQAVQRQLSNIYLQLATNQDFAALASRFRKPMVDDLSPLDEERANSFTILMLNTYGNVEYAYRNRHFSAHEYEEYRRAFRRTLARWPALVPRMHSVLNDFDADYYGVFTPLFEPQEEERRP